MLQYGVQYILAVIGLQFQQGFIDGGQGEFIIGGGFVIGQFYLYLDFGCGVDGISWFVGVDGYLQVMVCIIYVDFGDVEFLGWFGKIDDGVRFLVFVEFMLLVDWFFLVLDEEGILWDFVYVVVYG